LFEAHDFSGLKIIAAALINNVREIKQQKVIACNWRNEAKM